MVKLLKIEKDEFTHLHEAAHVAIFGRDARERFDFAVMAVDEKDHPVHYYTVLEIDKRTAFILYGGAMPDFRGKGKSFDIMSQIVDFIQLDYPVVKYTCKNDNVAMIKFGAKKGFKIVGLSMVENHPSLEHSLGE